MLLQVRNRTNANKSRWPKIRLTLVNIAFFAAVTLLAPHQTTADANSQNSSSKTIDASQLAGGIAARLDRMHERRAKKRQNRNQIKRRYKLPPRKNPNASEQLETMGQKMRRSAR